MLTPLKKRSISDEVFIQLKRHIEDGTYEAGTKLPTEKELGVIFQVSRQPVREALRSLNALGYIEPRQGEGSFVTYDKSELSIQPINFELLSEDEYFDLVELRHILEVRASGLCALRHQPDDLERIQSALNEIRDRMSDDVSSGFEADYLFHKAIIKGSGNRYIMDTFKNINDKYLVGLKHSLSMNIGNDQKRKEVINEHVEIFKAIKERNQKKAMDKMNIHLVNLRLKMGDERVTKEMR